jgi:SAM-dependent methyltransferase
MLQSARRRSAAPTAVADVERLGLRSGVFNTVLCAFMLFHVTDPLAGLREIHRMLAEGGHVGIVVWGDDPGTPGSQIWREELDAAGAASDRDAMVLRHDLMNTPAKLTKLLGDAGLAPHRVWGKRFEHPWTLPDLLDLHLGCGMPARRLESLSADEQGSCRARAEARLSQLTPEELIYRAEVLFAIGRRLSA